MAARRIPPDAVTYYLSMGPARSYQKVAARYGVAKRAVTKLAAKEKWEEKVAEIERTALRAAEEKARSEVEAAYERHMKALRMVFVKGVTALNSMAIDSPTDAMRAIQLAIREERVALGEPTDRTAVSVEETIKREYERWMVVEDEDEDPERPSRTSE